MYMKCLDCNYNCGTPHTLLFDYKIEHKDKVSKCTCGNKTRSGNCVEEISSKLRVTASKCANSSSSPSSIFSSSSSSNPNLRRNWETKGEAPFTDSNSNLQSNFTDYNSNLRSSFTDSNSNLQSFWGNMGEATLA